jgi:hypothetical protein
MIVIQARRGMALVAVLAIMSLLAILAVATLSVTTRLSQGSALAARDAHLDAAASYALATALIEWRQRGLSSLGTGSSGQIDVAVPGSPVHASVTITRLGSELFWIVAEAVAVDDSRRRENMVVRLSIPRADSMSPLLVAGDVSLSRLFTVAHDSTPGCAPIAPDLVIGPGASFSSVDGSMPSLTVQRSASAVDSSFLLHIGSLSMTTLATSADLVLEAGTSTQVPSGVVHATGDLTLIGGAGQGVLLVDGRLTLAGPVSFVGLIVARGGIVATAAGAEVTGSIRTGPAGIGENGAMEITHQFTLRPSACATQTVLRSAVIPRAVSGRPWAEIY